jgi:hypothetical protein
MSCGERQPGAHHPPPDGATRTRSIDVVRGHGPSRAIQVPQPVPALQPVPDPRGRVAPDPTPPGSRRPARPARPGGRPGPPIRARPTGRAAAPPSAAATIRRRCGRPMARAPRVPRPGIRPAASSGLAGTTAGPWARSPERTSSSSSGSTGCPSDARTAPRSKRCSAAPAVAAVVPTQASDEACSAAAERAPGGRTILASAPVNPSGDRPRASSRRTRQSPAGS